MSQNISDKEQFVCLNCYHVGELAEDLRCFKCQSDSVVSTEILRSKAPVKSVSLRPQPQPRQWYHIKVGLFETVVSSNNATNLEEAFAYARSSKCEWYFVDVEGRESLVADTTLLDHSEFLEWCHGKWL